jgi:hypothetical protein
VLDVTATGKGKTRVLSAVDLRWTDHADNEDGFKVERCEELGKGMSMSQSCAWGQIGTTGVDEVSFSDTALPSDGSFRYRVRAYNGAGDSAYSNAPGT